SRARGAQCDAPPLARERDPLGRHLQRARHRGAHPARAPRREIQGRARGGCLEVQPSRLRPGRNPRSVPRHQTGRPPPRRPPSGVTMWRPALVLLALLTVLTGIVYPLAITGISQLVFHEKANGSLIVVDGKVLGSRLIGRPFDDPKYFWSRPSA